MVPEGMHFGNPRLLRAVLGGWPNATFGNLDKEYILVGKVRPWDSMDTEYVLYGDGDLVLVDLVEEVRE